MRIYRARMRSRAVVVQELFAVLGLAVGVALLFASQVASTSLDGSVSQLSRQLVGDMQLQLEARGPAGFPTSLLRRVREIPGVREALPVLEQEAQVIGPRGAESVELLGTGPQFAHAGGPLLRRFSAKQLNAQRALALPAPVARTIGAGSLLPIEVRIGAHVTQTLLGATLQRGDIGDLVESPVAVAPVAYAEKLAGTDGQITRIFVKTQPRDLPSVRAALQRLAGTRLAVEPADYDSVLFSKAAGPANAGASLFSAISALVGFIFAFNALLITAQLRRDLIGELRRHGATRGMTVQVLLFDALLLGLLGCALGLGIGELLSVLLFHPEPGYLAYAFPAGSQRTVTWHSIAVAVGAGMLSACVGVLAPLRGALARVAGSHAPLPRSLARRRWAATAIGIAGLAATSAIVTFDPAAAIAGCIALLGSMLALLPTLFDVLSAAVARLTVRLRSAPPRLAAIELRTPATRTRSLAIAAIGAVAVFGAVAIKGAQQNLQRGFDRVAAEVNRSSDVWVAAAGSANTLGTTPFAPHAVHKLRHLAPVASVGVYRGGFLNVGDRRVWVIAPPSSSREPVPPGQLLGGDSARVESRLREGGWAVLSSALAAERHLRIGESFTLESPLPGRFRLAALSTDFGWPAGAILVSSRDYARAWGSEDASALQVALRSGVPPSTGAAEIRAALGRRSGLTVQTAAQRESRWLASSREGLSRLSVIALLVLVAAVLATAGAMAALIWQRRPQLAYLKRQGYRRAVLWRALILESALLFATGCLIGALFGLYGQALLSHALATVTGFPVVLTVGPLLAVWSVAAVSVAAAVVVAAPGYLAARVAPSVSPG